MCNKVNSVSLEYGDAKITFFRIQLQTEVLHQPLWHDHGYYEIHLCTKTPLQYTFSSGNVLLNPGEMLIIPPGVSHNSIGTEGAENVKVISFAVTPTENGKGFYEAFTSALDANALKPLNSPPGAHAKADAFDEEGLYYSLLGICKLKSAAAEFIYLLFVRILKNDNIAVCDKTEIPILLDNLINRPDVSLDEIAAATHYSKRHVSRLIKKQYGVSLSMLRQKNKESPNEKK